MKVVYASTVNYVDPLAALAVGEQPELQARPLWSTVSVRMVTVDHYDVWSLQGVGLATEQTSMILGTDAVGILDEDIPGKHGLKAGSEVVLYAFVGTDSAGVASGERCTILSEKYPGTMAEKTSVSSANVSVKPASLIAAKAVAFGTSWLTAYSLLFDAAGIEPGDSVPIQGAGGGVPTVAIQLAHVASLEVFVTSRDVDKHSKVLKPGANAALEIGARLPRKADAVIESVGVTAWSHSMKSVRPGGAIAICGATTGDQPGAELTRLLSQDVRVQGRTMGPCEDFARLLHSVEHASLCPVIDSAVSGLDTAPEAFAKVIADGMSGKVVIEL